MKGTNLGEFEELVLLTVAALNDDAYAVAVKEEIADLANRKVNISAIHSALYRLEDKGFLSSEFGSASRKRGGKKKRIFMVTSAGFAALGEIKRLREKFWNNIPQLSYSVRFNY